MQGLYIKFTFQTHVKPVTGSTTKVLQFKSTPSESGRQKDINQLGMVYIVWRED